jgi:hypothetical protein
MLCSVPTRDFAFVRHDHRIRNIDQTANELHVAALLTRFNETCPLQSTLDFAEGLRLKPPQPRPQPSGRLKVAWPWEARNATQVPLLGSTTLPLPSRPGWPHPLPGTETHTSVPRAKRSRQMDVSCIPLFHSTGRSADCPQSPTTAVFHPQRLDASICVMRHRRSFTSIFGASLVTGRIAHSVCVNGHPAIPEEYKTAKAVVAELVVSQREVPETKDGFWYERTMYTVRIEGTLRGSMGGEAEIFSESSSARFIPAVVIDHAEKRSAAAN